MNASKSRSGRPKPEIRIRMVLVGFNGRHGTFEPQPIVRLGTVGAWSMVRRTERPHAVPFVISNKEWDKLEVQAPE